MGDPENPDWAALDRASCLAALHCSRGFGGLIDAAAFELIPSKVFCSARAKVDDAIRTKPKSTLVKLFNLSLLFQLPSTAANEAARLLDNLYTVCRPASSIKERLNVIGLIPRATVIGGYFSGMITGRGGSIGAPLSNGIGYPTAVGILGVSEACALRQILSSARSLLSVDLH
ncbi:hypothetical protein [Herbaspirillum huttiense]|uniref:Uncharacterized protein n=1 Tax=Herbaspirillum huttiense subsp. lycopersici TaxID=3074428 RepID=A0ABU2EFW0_9BURK|nr:hypothetical protein [Herbaspirillum huttiense]MDR9846728.1 hypothetical protein [Herbaspirillum huttiense SE1]